MVQRRSEHKHGGSTGVHQPSSSKVSFAAFKPSTSKASRIARSSSRKVGTKCELLLREELHKRGLSFDTNVEELPGKPDIVLRKEGIVCFCDGDFWHGRNLRQRIEKLSEGSNAVYWVAKIRGNVRRDRAVDRLLRYAGWRVIRLWESDIQKDLENSAEKVLRSLRGRRTGATRRPSSPMPRPRTVCVSLHRDPPPDRDDRRGRR